MTEDDLNGLFTNARHAAPQVPAGLTARVLADAMAEMPALPPLPQPLRAKPRIWASLGTLFGGGGALAGMVTATLAGFWIGFAQPIEIGAMATVFTGQAAEIDMMPGLDALLDEAP